MSSKRKNILQLDSKTARDFFLEERSYCNFDLPPYIKFEPLLKAINAEIEKENIEFKNMGGNTAKKFDNVNYLLFNNKNGKYDWRPFELINPFIYVYLVREITAQKNWEFIQNNFKKLSKNNCVKCHSIPIKSQSSKSNKAEQIAEWWERVEQESIKYSLEFEYLFDTDITNFYPSIYTHSISWALHTKETAKERKGHLLGDKIDKYIMAMSYGQTNGIPQGSVLMDFIAEIVLVYIDSELSKKLQEQKINKTDFRIIRYRDDYKIFVNNPQIADLILKNLSIILAETGLKLNPNKTIASQNVIQDSIKKDKVEWLFIESNLKEQTTLQKQLIIFHKFALAHQNSGTLNKILQMLLKDLHESKSQNKKNATNRLFKTQLRKDKEVLIAILVDIASLNPKIYPVAMSILGFLLDKIKCQIFIKNTIQKLQKINNNAYMQIWLQRVIIKLNVKVDFDELICNEVDKINSLPKNEKYEVHLWNLKWLNCNELKSLIKQYPIIDKLEIDNLEKYAQPDEVNPFEYG